MADDRPVDDPVQQLGKLQADFEDFRSTMLARLSRRPTGDIEPTIRESPKAGTLFLQGQVVNRADYPALWQWVNDNGLLQVGLFGPANGTTTFGLPNFSGRYIIGAGVFETITYGVGDLVGDNFLNLVTANMPAHDHNVSVSSNGDHDGHVSQSNINHPTGGGYLHGHPPSWGEVDGSHSHTVNESTVGSGSAFDNRPASVTVNWMVWT